MEDGISQNEIYAIGFFLLDLHKQMKNVKNQEIKTFTFHLLYVRLNIFRI